MLVEAMTSILTAGPSAPVAVEQYGDEQRLYFDSDRQDKLTMRVLSDKEDHRVYLPGRPDHMKEVRLSTAPITFQQTAESDNNATSGEDNETLSTPSSSTNQVRLLDAHFIRYQRPDRVASFKRSRTGAHVTYHVLLSEPQQHTTSASPLYPFVEIAVTLKAQQLINVPYGDSAASLWREKKLLHTAVKFDADNRGPGGALEVYQDHENQSMRITLEDPVTLLPQITEFDNTTPNDSELYEENKIALMEAVKFLVAVEREMYVRVSVDPNSVAEERERLAQLTLMLFRSSDVLTRDVPASA